MTKRASVLDVIGGVMETTGTGIRLTVNPDVPQAMAIETGFVVIRVVR